MSLKAVNNLGTILYTVFGKEVGRDNLGNRYFIKKNPQKMGFIQK